MLSTLLWQERSADYGKGIAQATLMLGEHSPIPPLVAVPPMVDAIAMANRSLHLRRDGL